MSSHNVCRYIINKRILLNVNKRSFKVNTSFGSTMVRLLSTNNNSNNDNIDIHDINNRHNVSLSWKESFSLLQLKSFSKDEIHDKLCRMTTTIGTGGTGGTGGGTSIDNTTDSTNDNINDSSDNDNIDNSTIATNTSQHQTLTVEVRAGGAKDGWSEATAKATCCMPT